VTDKGHDLVFVDVDRDTFENGYFTLGGVAELDIG